VPLRRRPSCLAAPRFVAGQAEWPAGAARQEEAPAGAAGQAERPIAGVAVQEVEEVEEVEPPARAGHWVARVAAGPAEIRRARSWAPQVPDQYQSSIGHVPLLESY
jgi:hypothetical protein